MIVQILLLLFILNAIFLYLIILGGSKNKTDEERKIEDEEQIKYLKECNKIGK